MNCFGDDRMIGSFFGWIRMTFMVLFIVLPAGDVHMYSLTIIAIIENLTVSFLF
jgi:hypothetical protein